MKDLKSLAASADRHHMQEKRAEVRMLCADMVDVYWKDRSSRARRATALLEDISRSGACLQFETAIPLGTRVRIACARERLEGTVRYCVYREVGYFVGLEFAAGTKWSRRQFEPQHLLNLERLVLRSAKRATRRVQ